MTVQIHGQEKVSSVIYKSIVDIASDINAMGAVSIAAYDFENKFDAADAALVSDNSNMTATKAASVFDNANLTADKAASIFDNANLTSSKAASIFNETALTVAKLISILDNANITSAKIKSIFETGSLSVDEKRAATLEGDQYAAADAADSVNGSFYTDTQLALAFDNTNLTASKAASICAEAGLTQSRFNSIFNDTNLTDVKLSSILNNSNFVGKAQKGQECFDAMSRSKAGFTNGIHISEILDDWSDNKITSRDNAVTTATGFTDRFGKTFRPEWTVDATGWDATDTELLSSSDGATISIPSTFNIGTWEYDAKIAAPSSVQIEFVMLLMWVDSDNYIRHAISTNNSTHQVDLSKKVAGALSTLITHDNSSDTMHTYKITRDGSGNFEIFDNGVSKGTATDTDISISNRLKLWAPVSGPTHVDNLKVY